MSGFSRDILEAAEREHEIEFETFGRRTGKSSNVIIWITRDGDSLFIRSGGGLARDWPQNLKHHGRGVLHLAGQSIPVKARHVEDVAEAKRITRAVQKKYQSGADGHDQPADAPPVPAELATFELLP
ncbi:MAG: nitroreductase/quinone reductase family protein, partial [Thermomicrobiales bacterium]